MTNTKPWWKEPTRAQWAAFAAAWVGWVLDAFDFTIYICVTTELMKEFGVSATAVAGSLTLTLLVRLVGGFVAGWMADRWGRKLPLMMSLVWFAIFDAAIYFAPTFGWVLAFRTIFGFGMGAEWTAGTALAMESFPEKSRKFASGLLQAGWPVGFLLAAATAHYVVPAYGWRAMFLIAAAPALLVLPIRLLVREDHAAASTTAAKPSSALKDLAAPGVFRMLVLGSLVMALGFVVYYGMMTPYMNLHQELAGSPQDIAGRVAAAKAGWNDMILFNVGMLVGVILAGRIANRFGVIAALVVPALLMVPAIPLFVGAVPSLMPVGAILGGLLGVGYSGVTPVLTTSLFPAHVRARAIGIVYHTGALLAAFVPTFVPWLSSTTHMTLATTIALVVGSGLVIMSAAVLAVRGSLVPTEQPTASPKPALPSNDAVTAPYELALRPETLERSIDVGGRHAALEH